MQEFYFWVNHYFEWHPLLKYQKIRSMAIEKMAYSAIYNTHSVNVFIRKRKGWCSLSSNKSFRLYASLRRPNKCMTSKYRERVSFAQLSRYSEVKTIGLRSRSERISLRDELTSWLPSSLTSQIWTVLYCAFDTTGRPDCWLKSNMLWGNRNLSIECSSTVNELIIDDHHNSMSERN